MASGIFNVGISGLSAAQMGMLTTSHNIANASTPGFTRQEIIQTTNMPTLTGDGFVGTGTNVQTVRRIFSQFLNSQTLSAQTGAAEMDSYLAQIKQIDNLLADPSAGLSPALSSFFTGVQDVAANPASIPSRQSMLSGAEALVARFQALDQTISGIRDGVNQQVISEIETINAMTEQLGQINQRIILAQAAGGGQPANDLLDQRDQLVADINKEIRVQTTIQSDGTYSLFIGNGQPLVVGTQVLSLQAVQALDDPQKITVALLGPTGSTIYLPESMLAGGNLGGLLSFRATSLDPAQNALGRIAIGLAQNFNDIHRLGQDLTGALGGSFFNVAAPVVNASSVNASAATILSAQIVNSDYRVTYNGVTSNYDITRLSDGAAAGSFAAGSFPAIVDGVKITLSGAANAGDTFVVRPGNPAGSRVIPESDNSGTAVLDSAGSNIQALQVSDYRLVYSAANTFTLTRVSDNASWTGTGASVAAALTDLATKQQVGFTLSLSGTAPTVGDSFIIQPTRMGARDMSVAITDARNVAAAAPFRTSASLTNTGTATISSGSVDDKTYLPLTAPVTLTFNSATNQFAVAGAVPAAGNISYNPATQTSVAISINGLAFTISGTPRNGDAFVLGANSNGVADNRTAQLLGNLQTQNTLAGTPGSTTASATASYQSAYSQIVSQTGNKTREIEVTGKAQQSLADQAQTARDELSAVNLDEEAANLMRYQQAYQAAAKMLDIAGKLFDEILAMGR